MDEKPRVGIGVLIINSEGKILIGKRKGVHEENEYSIPGGKLGLGETFEETAIREIKEETNLNIKNPAVYCVANNVSIEKYNG